MKKLLLTAITVLCFFAVSLAQKNNAIKVNPLAVLGGTDLVSFERRFGDHSSGVFSATFINFKVDSSKYRAAGAGFQYRYYFNDALKGWYGAAAADYQIGDARVKSNSKETEFTSAGAGLRLGFQWIILRTIAVDISVGAAYKDIDYEDADGGPSQHNFKSSGVYPTAGLGFGIVF